jgi:phage/plasmid-associated DNA primase
VPTLNTLTGGSVRRIRIIPFPFQFVANPKDSLERQGDANLKNVFCRSPEWRDQFVLMLFSHFQSIKGCKEIAIPPMVKERTDEYISDCDIVGPWINEMYTIDNSKDNNGKYVYIMRARELYNQFKVDTGSSMTERAFKNAMEFNKFYAKRTKTSMEYVGLRRKDE